MALAYASADRAGDSLSARIPQAVYNLEFPTITLATCSLKALVVKRSSPHHSKKHEMHEYKQSPSPAMTTKTG